MQLITEDIARAVRRKRADLALTKIEACREIGLGLNGKTLKNIEAGNCKIKPSIYVKVTQWLAKDY